jgi:hypothetical protein
VTGARKTRKAKKSRRHEYTLRISSLT